LALFVPAVPLGAGRRYPATTSAGPLARGEGDPERNRPAPAVGRVHEAGVFMLKLVQAVLSYFLDTEHNQLLMRRHEAYQRQQRWLEYLK
jgi:hypothetical protein